MPMLKSALSAPDGATADIIGGVANALKVSRSEVEAAWRKSVLDAR